MSAGSLDSYHYLKGTDARLLLVVTPTPARPRPDSGPTLHPRSIPGRLPRIFIVDGTFLCETVVLLKVPPRGGRRGAARRPLDSRRHHDDSHTKLFQHFNGVRLKRFILIFQHDYHRRCAVGVRRL